MRLLRLRILALMLFASLVPLALVLAGFRWLPAGFLFYGWAGLVGIFVIVGCVSSSAGLARPVRDLAAAFDQMMRTGGEHRTKSRRVPAEFDRVQRAFSLLLQENKQRLASAENESARLRQKLLDADRLNQRCCGIIQAVFHASRDGVLVQDKSGRILASNEALDTLLGRPAEQVSGRDGSRLLAEIAARLASVGEFEALIERTGEDPAHTGGIEGDTTSTPPGVLAVHTAPVRAADGAVIGRLWMLRDCTEHRRLTEQLQQAQKMESIGQLAGGIAHDFNNLLTAIGGNLTLAEMSHADRPEEAKEKLRGAARATARAAELVKQLLGYSRKNAAAPRPVDLNVLVAEVENILRHSIDPRVAVRLHPGSDLWPVLADPVNIEQVILNVCLNARDALPEGGGRIDITTANHALDERSTPVPDVVSGVSEFVVIRVKDNGCGIPEEQRGHVFDPFFSTKAAGKGTGLGLVTAQSIVQEHGGWIEFDSEAGKGTEFRIYLPRAEGASVPPPAAPVAAAVPEAPVVPRARQGRASGSLLVVDDEAAVRSIAVTMLEHLGYTVAQASDGGEALEKIAAAPVPFDAILLDLCMPKLSGRDTFKHLRDDGCTTPVVVCSGFSIDPAEFSVPGGSEDGEVQVIQKPYSMDVLARTIARAVAGGRRSSAVIRV